MNPLHPFPVRPLLFALGLGLAGLLQAAPVPRTVYVDPAGLDSWSGVHPRPRPDRHQGPVATIGAAIAKARELHQDLPGERITIQLAPGRHELSGPLELGPEDSHLDIVGSTGRRASILYGSRIVEGWTAPTTRNGPWEAILTDIADGARPFNQLFLNGARQQPARTPNTGFFTAAGPLSRSAPIELPFRPGDIRAGWAGDPAARVGILMKWTDLHLPLRAVDPDRNIARLTLGPRSDWMDEPDARYWVEGTADSLDAPGEWHLDRASGRLRLLPPEGLRPDKALVTVPLLRSLVRIHGTPGNPVRHVRFRNLTFAESDFEMPAEGLASPQAAIVVPGTFIATHAVECALDQCRFRDIGGYAVELGRGCQQWSIDHCLFEDIGAGALRIGDPADRDPQPPDANHSHRLADNVLTRLGRVFAPAVGILILHSGTNRIVHNHINDLYYTAISVGWNWGYQSTPCRANEIAYNLVEKVGQGRLSDMGGIYTLGPQPGTHIHHNLFRDIQSYRYGGWGLYTDEGSTGIRIEDNVVYRCKDAGFHQHYGRDNVIQNNLLAFNSNHQVMRTRAEEHLSFSFLNNVVIHDAGTLLGSNWSGSTNQFRMNRNTYWDSRLGTNTAAYRFHREDWTRWQARGQDTDSLIADPLLKDPSRPELGLRPGSPAFRTGFRPIDLRNVGPRPRR